MLSQLGELLGLPGLRHAADALALALPFEALYQHVLSLVAGRLGDISGLGLGVGPFGGARRMDAWELAVLAAWTGVVGLFAVGRARRLDL
jgi:hypothetical protein